MTGLRDGVSPRYRARRGADDWTPGGAYSASTWDHDLQDWVEYAKGVPLMALRRVVRDLEAAGWSELSYRITRD